MENEIYIDEIYASERIDERNAMRVYNSTRADAKARYYLSDLHPGETYED
jgi:hypothetical protein